MEKMNNKDGGPDGLDRDRAHAAELRQENRMTIGLLVAMGFCTLSLDALIVAAFTAVGLPVVGWIVGAAIMVGAVSTLYCIYRVSQG